MRRNRFCFKKNDEQHNKWSAFNEKSREGGKPTRRPSPATNFAPTSDARYKTHLCIEKPANAVDAIKKDTQRM